jgi:hypothetical protein
MQTEVLGFYYVLRIQYTINMHCQGILHTQVKRNAFLKWATTNSSSAVLSDIPCRHPPPHTLVITLILTQTSFTACFDCWAGDKWRVDGRGDNKQNIIHTSYRHYCFLFSNLDKKQYNLQDRIRWTVFPGEKKTKGKIFWTQSVEDINIRVDLWTMSLYNAALQYWSPDFILNEDFPQIFSTYH